MSAPDSPSRRSTWWLGWDLPILYALAVTVVSLWIAFQPGGRDLVLQASTNLDNMRSRPLQVLLLSLCIVSPLWFLLLLIPLVVLYREVQRWLGRIALVITVLICHVGASLCVMVAEIVAISARAASPAIEGRHDVGVSYGLAGTIGLLLVRVPPKWRLWYGLASVAGVVALILFRSSFSAIGHGSAWAIGIALGWLVYVSARQVTPRRGSDR